VNEAASRFVVAADLRAALIRREAPYDLVFANILARPLVGLAQEIRGALKPGGVAILSGLLRPQARMVLAAYLSRGFRLQRRLGRDAWATLVLRRR
jgi:ribosomal protein L11 methyltransferase